MPLLHRVGHGFVRPLELRDGLVGHEIDTESNTIPNAQTEALL